MRGLNSGKFLAAIATGFAVVSASVASAAVVLPYSGTFESDTLGGAPAGWQVPSYASVITGSSTNGLGTNAQVLSIVDGTSGDGGWEAVAEFGTHTAADGPLTVAFKFLIPAGENTTDLAIAVREGAGGLAGISSYLRIQAASNAISFYNVGNAFEGLFTGIQRDTWYEVTQQFDLSAETFSVQIDNLSDASPAQHVAYSGIAIYNQGENPTLDRLRITPDSGAVNILLDDVRITAVPEPVSAGLLGAAGLLLMRRRR